MKAFFSGVFWVCVALAVSFWGLFVVDLTSYAKMGNIHELVDHSIEVAGSRDEVFAKVSGLQALPIQEEPESESDVPAEVRPRFTGESMLELPGFEEYGAASLLLVEHRLSDFLLFQERYETVVFLHSLGFEQVSPGVTEISWQIQSPNTQWWFHGFIMYPATYLWKLKVAEVLDKIKENVEKG